ncbi:uncharacterized protein LOC113071237, partial [Tachysurus ichikawai]
MASPPRGGGAHMAEVLQSPGGFVFDPGDLALSPLVLSLSPSPVRSGCHGTVVAEARPVRLSPNRTAPWSSGESSPGWSPTPPTAVEAVAVAPEGTQFIAAGLSTEVVETLLHSRASSTRRSYTARWRLFTSWCEHRGLEPVNCPIGSVLEFLQEQFAASLTPSTLKVYVSAITAYSTPLAGQSLGRHPLVTRFLRGARRLRPGTRLRVPVWHLPSGQSF